VTPVRKSDALQGALELLVLKTLGQGPQHGYGIAMRIMELSDHVLRVEEGSLYPALHRMEQEGWIAADWRVTEHKRRARWYSLTRAGQKRLADEQARWQRVAHGIQRVLRAT
jgi:transcriptional regulator